MRTLAAVFLCMLVAVPAIAGPPANGVYKSTDLGGTMLPGRMTETWVPSPLSVGNTLNEESWDGVTLGTQWVWNCAWIVAPPIILFDGVDGFGNGNKFWQVIYAGGICNLDGTGPWAGGDPSYTGIVNAWSHIVTETYANFVEIGTVWSTNANATFVGYNSECMSLVIDNGAKQGDTNGGLLAANYPDFFDYILCISLGTAGPGQWGDIFQITLQVVDCQSVGTEKRTWGGIKTLYDE